MLSEFRETPSFGILSTQFQCRKGFRTFRRNSLASAGQPTIQLNSYTIYSEIALGSTGEGFSPTDCLPTSTFRCQASHKPRLSPVLLMDLLQSGGYNNHLLGLQTPATNPGCYLYFSVTCFQLRGSQDLYTSGSTNLLEGLTEPRGTFYLPDHQFIIKGYDFRTARWKRHVGQGMGKGRGASMPS